MGLFNFLKDKSKSETKSAPASSITFPVALGAVSKGTAIPMSKIPDEVFSSGVLGTCCGIIPAEGKVYAPVNGKITQLADTLHAIGIETGGMEILIHVGVNTVEMNGDGFSAQTKLDKTVEKGELLLTMDLEKIRAAGHDTTVIMAVTNSDDFASVEEMTSGDVNPGDEVIRVSQ